VLCAGDVMVHAIWPTVSLRPTNVTVNSAVAAANAGDYVDWVDASQGISIPVEGQGDRVQLQLQASIEPVYTSIQNASMNGWSYAVPSISGVDFWSGASGGAPLSGVDSAGDVLNGSFSLSGQFSGMVWASVDSGSTLAAGGTVQIAGELDGPDDADVQAFVPCSADTTQFDGWKLYTPGSTTLAALDAQATLLKYKGNEIGVVSAAMQSHFSTFASLMFKKNGFPTDGTDSGKSMAATTGKNIATTVTPWPNKTPVPVPANALTYWMQPIAYVGVIDTDDPWLWKITFKETSNHTDTFPDGSPPQSQPGPGYNKTEALQKFGVSPFGDALMTETSFGLYSPIPNQPNEYLVVIVDEPTASVLVDKPGAPTNLPAKVKVAGVQTYLNFSYKPMTSTAAVTQVVTLTPPKGKGNPVTTTIDFKDGIKFNGDKIPLQVTKTKGPITVI